MLRNTFRTALTLAIFATAAELALAQSRVEVQTPQVQVQAQAGNQAALRAKVVAHLKKARADDA